MVVTTTLADRLPALDPAHPRPPHRPVTVEDLYAVREGKAELVGGALLFIPVTGRGPGYASDMVMMSLHQDLRRRGRPGLAFGDGKGFLVYLPGRASFSPDAGLYVGPNSGMRFFQGAPRFAVEVRSEKDYGPASERAMAAKRNDYLAAGTLAVWGVDLESDDAVVRLFRDGGAETPAAVFRRGELAHAEPAVPGWTMPVDDLFEPAAGE